jgi:hypothetical protein
MDIWPGIPLIKDQLEIDVPEETCVMGKELAALQDGAKVFPDQPKTPIITIMKL